MLVLSRRENERIVIGDGVTSPLITITVCSVDRGKVRVGVDCPSNMPVYREELLPIRPAEPETEGGDEL